MDVQALPPYRGLPAAPRQWGEPDERGQAPALRLRDYVVLALLILVAFPVNLSLFAQLWAGHRNAESLNAVREQPRQEDVRPDWF